MTVFAWILFIISALVALGTLHSWFAYGEGLLVFFGSAACVVYMVFYLFLTPFGSVVTWIYFIVMCVFALATLLIRNIFGFIQYGTYVLFFALVLFL